MIPCGGGKQRTAVAAAANMPYIDIPAVASRENQLKLVDRKKDSKWHLVQRWTMRAFLSAGYDGSNFKL